MIRRREFLAAVGALAVPAISAGRAARGAEPSRTAPPDDTRGQNKLPIRDVKVWRVTGSAKEPREAICVEVVAESGLSGWSAPIGREQAFIVRTRLRGFLRGKDALAGEALWNGMWRLDRHARSGHMMMAQSAVDNALWDLRGKHFGDPVYRLLGGPAQQRLRAYSSMLGYSTEPLEACKIAREFFDRGFTAQKWFFAYTPADGAEGRRKNLDLVRVLREELGDGAELMFDCRWSWDVPYTIALARQMLAYRPLWLEEPLHPEQLEGYIRIKRETGIPLAAGEHLYTRWNVKPYLDAKALDFVQTDPEWTGGISELVKICALADAYDVQVVPHGHHIAAASHVVASQPVALCPMIEFLVHSHLERVQYFQKTMLRPERGWLSLSQEPGLGLSLDESKIKEKRELVWD